MPFLTLDEINNDSMCNPPASWVTDPLPYINDINKVGKWTASEFCGSVELPLKSYMWYKYKCLKNKTGKCFKTFYRDHCGKLYYSFKELKTNLRYGECLPDFEWSCTKKSIHYNLELDTLYIGGGGTGAGAWRLKINY